MVGGWACDLQSVKDPENSGLLRDVKEVRHNERDCYLMSSGEMNDSNTVRNHISRKIIDPESYKQLKNSLNFVIDPLNAWGMRTESVKVKKARKRYEDLKMVGKEEEYFETETLKDLVNFFAMDKYEISSVLVENDNCRPHIINKDKATRIVFETYDGSYIQIEQEMDLIMFLWDPKKKEDYFYREVSKFRDSTKLLFKGIISNLMRLRNSPLRFVPRDDQQKVADR
jgi:hypothetical protein